jgi:SanA protein
MPYHKTSARKPPILAWIRGGFLTLIFLTAVLSLSINGCIACSARDYVYRNLDDVPAKTAVMVLGSQTRGTSLSPVLRDRVDAGIAAVQAGKGKKLLLSGDHGELYYDEVNAMRLYVLANSKIAAEDIFMDHAGFKTYDSMYRARDVFEVKDLVIITQEFHVGRAVYLARSLGLDAVGYAVNQDRFAKRSVRYWQSREFLAGVKAFFLVISGAKPRYLGTKIPITGDGRATWK